MRRKILPKGYKLDYTGDLASFCARKATSSCPPSCSRVILIFLVLAAQFNSFRDPLIIILGSVPLAMFGALMFLFSEDAESRTSRFGRTAGRPR